MVSVALLVGGCGSSAGVDSVGGASGATSGGSAQASGGSVSAASNTAGQGGAGAAPGLCKMVDGKAAYGPIGESVPWPMERVSDYSGNWGACSLVEETLAFRAGAGYAFVWCAQVDGNSPNLFSMTVAASFEGGEPRPLLSKSSAAYLDVASAPNGFVVTNCSSDYQPEWIFLNRELDLVAAPELGAQGASCKFKAPSVVWTGQRYLTSFTDTRGLVLASLDEQGTLIEEKVLSAEVHEPVWARFSKNGDRVLLVFRQSPMTPLRFSVLDLQGTPFAELQPFGPVLEGPSEFVISPSRDGWWVVNDSANAERNTGLLTAISRDGLVVPKIRDFGYLKLGALKASPYGGSLLVASRSEGGQYAHSFALTVLIDDDGESVYSTEQDFASKVGEWPLDVVADQQRDLVVEWRAQEGSARRTVVQEYGCLE